MSFFDLILIVLIAIFGFFGLWAGFIHTLGSLIGTVVGAYLAARYYQPMADWLIHVTGWGGNAARVIMFIVAFILINRLVGFIFWFVDKAFKIFTILPFISKINRLLGLIFGIGEGLVTIGLVIFFIQQHRLSDTLMELINKSEVAPHTVKSATIFMPFIPMIEGYTKTSVDFVEKVVK